MKRAGSPTLSAALGVAAACSVAWIGVGCASRSPHPQPEPQPLGSVAATASPAASTVASAAPSAPPGRKPAVTTIASPTQVTLSVGVRPTPAQTRAMLVHSDLIGGFSYTRWIDKTGKLSAPRVLADRHPVTLLGDDLLVTSRGTELCFERTSSSSSPVCHELRGDFVMLVDGQPVVLEQREEPKPEEPKAPKRRRGKKAKQPPKQLPQKPIEMRSWLHRFDGDGKRVGKAIDSGLVVKMPLPGMGVIDAAPHKAGMRVIHYQHDKPRRDGRRYVQQAKLFSVLIGRDGKMMRRTKREIYRGDRAYGHIAKHHAPRLFGERVLVGRFIDRDAKPLVSRWEARRLGPVRTVPAPNAVLGVDPWRLSDPRVVGAAELAVLSKIYDAAPRLAVGQPANEAGRVAWVRQGTTKRGYFLAAGKLSSASRADGNIRPEPAPFVAKRSQVSWAAMDASGRGIAQTDGGLVVVGADGTHDVAQANHDVIGTPVRIGSDWWGVVASGTGASGARVVRLTSSEAEASALSSLAHAGAHVLVGGANAGMFASLTAGRLRVLRMTPEGATTELGAVGVGALQGLLGVARPGGGMLLIAPKHVSTEYVALAIDAGGELIGEHTITVAGRPQMVALGGGAVIIDGDGAHVQWLDANAKPVGRVAWPAATHRLACVDGTPARETIPSPTPTKLERIGALAGEHCWSVPFPPRTADGHHRWIGTALRGIDSRAVVASLPATSAVTVASVATAGEPLKRPAPKASPCPADMVSIAGKYCIDRFETQLVDAATGSPLSPDYPATSGILKNIFVAYAARRWTIGDLRARAMPLPPLLRAQSATPAPVARSRAGVRPNGYMTWYVANKACKAAGKRLCSRTEWVTACRGEQDRKFPYGDKFAHHKCNVWRFAHPAAALHGNASVGHLDPRLNRVLEGDKPLLHPTGTTHRCASRWGDDAVYDMVGNLDEWFDHKKGAFAGGFYSRTTKKGCGAVITAHPKRYLDYSLGTRCCQAADKPSGE